ncbi:MAG: general secretion pathway protein GspF [Gammaproteobacteria bacterium]|nr:general secretion pathway protein GspF [Gammaproteobacteria bacterium]
MMKRPATMDVYIDLVNQALVEVEELRFSIEYDEEFMEDAMGFVGQLESQLKEMEASMKDGSYQFVDEDLPFMATVKSHHQVILPFKGLLSQINNTHRQGLEEE